MTISRLMILAVALTWLSAASNAAPGMHRHALGSTHKDTFGTCARGPCIHQVNDH